MLIDLSVSKRTAKPSPSSRALKRLMPGVLEPLEAVGIHRTEIYRYAAGTVTPSADRAAAIERETQCRVLANGWTPDGYGGDVQALPAPESPAKAS